MHFPYVCVLDFEATCDKSKKWIHEIIEFPSVLLKWNPEKGNYEKVSEIQYYCRPLDNGKVTDFCLELTGITQETVNKGVDFPYALQQHYSWLARECKVDDVNVPIEDRVIIVTCGAWDLNTMFPAETRRWNIGNPQKVYRRFVNIKDEYRHLYKHRDRKGMATMLEDLKIPLEGRHHSGIDDCRNIAKIWMRLVTDGYDTSDPGIVDVETSSYKIRENKKKYKQYREMIAARRAEKIKKN